MAGLEFLSRTQARFGILFCALECAFAEPMANNIIHEHATLPSFKFLMATFLVLSVILGICPLVVWAPKLAGVRRTGLREYAKLGNRYTKEFGHKWLHHDESPEDSLLGSADIQSLADMGASYDLVRQMSMAPITKGLAVQLAVLAALPLIPVIVYATPTAAIVNAIMKMIA